MRDWLFQAAKNRFSEMVRRARVEGPRTVAVHGKADAYASSSGSQPTDLKI